MLLLQSASKRYHEQKFIKKWFIQFESDLFISKRLEDVLRTGNQGRCCGFSNCVVRITLGCHGKRPDFKHSSF